MVARQKHPDAQTVIKKMKRAIVEAAASGGEGHIPSAFSILDILWVLYDRVLRVTPKNIHELGRNHFILSKGQAALALYVVLAEKDFFSYSALRSYGKFSSCFGGHPDHQKVPGVEASTGSLGHGFPMAVGMALGLRIKGLKGKIFTLIGDGECNEGSVWEATLLAAHHKLSNLCCIVDYNHSTDRALLLGDLKAKFRAFGWETISINGHDHKQIHRGLLRKSASKPIVIIANTIKGFGVKRMENEPAWHHRAPTKDGLKEILEELL